MKRLLGRTGVSLPEFYHSLSVQPWKIHSASQIISLLYKMEITPPVLSNQLYSIMQMLDFVIFIHKKNK